MTAERQKIRRQLIACQLRRMPPDEHLSNAFIFFKIYDGGCRKVLGQILWANAAPDLNFSLSVE